LNEKSNLLKNGEVKGFFVRHRIRNVNHLGTSVIMPTAMKMFSPKDREFHKNHRKYQTTFPVALQTLDFAPSIFDCR
jgi:hypothetical protein